MKPKVDLIVRDQNEENLMAVEVVSQPVQPSFLPISEELQAASAKLPYSMLVDPEKILIFRGGFDDVSHAICTLKTGEIIQRYDPEAPRKRIFNFYLAALIDSWLRDLAYHWRSPEPPASRELDSIGLLQRIQGGFTEAEARI